MTPKCLSIKNARCRTQIHSEGLKESCRLCFQLRLHSYRHISFSHNSTPFLSFLACTNIIFNIRDICKCIANVFCNFSMNSAFYMVTPQRVHLGGEKALFRAVFKPRFRWGNIKPLPAPKTPCRAFLWRLQPFLKFLHQQIAQSL